MRVFLPLLSAIALSLCAGPAFADTRLPEGVFNMSSHSEAFFHRLLSGRVFVSTRETQRRHGRVQGFFFASDGTVRICTYHQARPDLWQVDDRWSWRVRSSWSNRDRRGRTVLNYIDNGRARNPILQFPFYAPKNGRFHTEYWFKNRARIPASGWIQESWPRFLRDACPRLTLPVDLPINEKQTARTIDAMAAQDPDAPIRNFVAPGGPSVNRRTPGGTGAAMAGGPTFPKDAFARWLDGHSGQVLDNLANSILWLPHPRFVLAPRGGPDGGTSELWWIDDRGGIVDTTRLEPSDDLRHVRLVSAGYPERPTYVVGYAWPMAGTGERHPAFLLTDHLASLDGPVTIPWWEQPAASFRFLSSGKVAATDEDGTPLSGRWWWSAGKLHVQVDDNSGDPPATYPWRELAAHVGWEIPEGWR